MNGIDRLLPSSKGLAILMYHKVSEQVNDGLTVSTDTLELHFAWLKEMGYQTLSFRELKNLMAERLTLPKKTVILTFDDAYRSFKELALPVLKKFGFKASVFVPMAYIGKTNLWDRGNDPIMTAEELNQISSCGFVEIGLHSFLHRNYRDLALPDIKEDLDNCFSILGFHHIPYIRVLAYPYGGYPGKDPELRNDMIQLFESLGIDYALRIGNRINPYPIRHPFEMKRIDIRGSDSFLTFRIKLKTGRVKLFI